eukprot:UN04929
MFPVHDNPITGAAWTWIVQIPPIEKFQGGGPRSSLDEGALNTSPRYG